MERYTKNLNTNNINYPNTSLEIGSVNILENENRVPINYVIPQVLNERKSIQTVT